MAKGASLTFYNVAICVVVASGAFTYGFGFAVFITSIGQPGFFLYFDLDPSSTYTANVLGAVNALFAFGAAVGAILQGMTADWLGRKKALGLAGLCALIGGALAAGSVAIEMLIIVRILQGIGLGMLICLVPLYTTEVAPAHKRGLLASTTVMGFASGYTVCALVSLGTNQSTNLTLQWRMPLALACAGPVVLLVGLFFIPESPRYLVWVNKHDEAWPVLQRIHNDPSDPTDAIARAELTQITRQVDFDKEQKAGYIQMFIKPSWRKRSILVMILMFAAQSTGILGIANYIVFISTSLGMTGSMPLIIYAIYSVIGTTSTFVHSFFLDRVGRRTYFLIGFPSLAACLLAEALLQWKYLGTGNKAGNAACLVVMFVYIILFQTIDTASFVWAAEVFPTTIRAKGLGLTMFAYFVGAITYTTPAALAFKNIKFGMYLLWCGLCLLSTVFVYYYIPETKCLPVEEIGALFGDDVMVHLTADGHGIVEAEKELAITRNNDDGDGTSSVAGEQGKSDEKRGSSQHQEVANV
ncbi:uncharacterized protein BP5553_06687 [Venustampulla echinocandica]|uniref:Major facilitator superfamily (MFS) profile domain-containing protein n=1 Tax=Venustampulla echinocandica TaxID=2656787 RepID=A0A370TKN2_9HELO|nr:uncharacterized protein BP5553_06687 [Venustampulla echinocandica]RDL36075.1 hypothetical protein BP5553_06687 [Venustampulla echinocandica]